LQGKAGERYMMAHQTRRIEATAGNDSAFEPDIPAQH
jgi:hypothetical protein